MLLPTLSVPQLLLFVEAASFLRDSSRALLQAGRVEADLPELIEAAQMRAEAQLQLLEIPTDLREQVRGILRLTPPQSVLAYLRDLLDRGSGPDLEAFLEQAGFASTLLRFPPLLVGAVALGLLLERLDFSPEEQAVLQAQRDRWERTLAELAAHHSLTPDPLRAATETQLRQASPEELLQLSQDLLPDLEDLVSEDIGGKSQLQIDQMELAGPLLFMMVADHLLTQTEYPLTPEQQLDLRANRAEAESRYLAMQKLGRIENLAEQQAHIQSWIEQTSIPDLLRALDEWFAVSELNP